MIPLLRHFVGWLVGAFRSRADLMLENLALRQQLLALHAKRPRRRLGSVDKVFWGRSPQAVVWVEETAAAGHPRNGDALASRRLPVVLVLAVADSTRRRQETREQGSARPDFPHGRREPDVGRTSHPR